MDPASLDLTTVAGVVAATILLVQVLKPMVGAVPWLNRLPTPVYVILVAALLTMGAHDLLGVLPGDRWDLLKQAIYQAAVASGVLEWLRAKGKAIGDTTAATGPDAMTLRSRVGVILLAAAVASVGTGCALKAKPRHTARALSVVIHDSLAALGETETALVQAGTLTPEQDRAFARAYVPVLTIGRDLNAVVLAWPEGAPTPPELLELVHQLNAITTDVLQVWPPGPARNAIANHVAAVMSAVRLMMGGVQ